MIPHYCILYVVFAEIQIIIKNKHENIYLDQKTILVFYLKYIFILYIMTTPYSVTTSIGSVSYNNYVNAPITGPLSTDQTPFHMPYHSYGTLAGIRPMPPQFYSSQEPVNADMNTNARYRYLRTAQSVQSLAIEREKSIRNTNGNSFFNFSTGKRYNTSGHMNYIEPIPASMYVDIKKCNAVGKSGYKVGLPIQSHISTKNYFPLFILIFIYIHIYIYIYLFIVIFIYL